MSRSLRRVAVPLVTLLILVAPIRSWANEAGVTFAGSLGVRRTTSELRELPPNPNAEEVPQARMKWEVESPERAHLPQEPGALERAIWPAPGTAVPDASSRSNPTVPFSPQMIGFSFDGATLTDTGVFPPDAMGAVGPSQFLVFVNGRIRTFSKATGLADGVMNINPAVFFSSVMTPVSPPITDNAASSPQIRYDRVSGRWFLTITDVPCTNVTCLGVSANRLLMAVSDAASAGTISPSTVWTFFFFQADGTDFLDLSSLGVDAKALYIGGNIFTPAVVFAGMKGYVVRKSSVLGAGPLLVTSFSLGTPGSEGAFSPQGVDNYDPASNEGYFIGVSALVFGRLVLRRVSDPGGTPTISSDLLITVNSTSSPIPVQHLGNSGGLNGRLGALDDRLSVPHIRNGRLWTAQNIAVTSGGVASNTDSQRRDGVRWYELDGIRSVDNGGVPAMVQSGTLFDPATNLASARQYWIPSVMVSGQGHAALGFSTAGTPYRADAGTVGRLSGDVLGTMQTVTMYTNTATSYNPLSDPGGSSGRRWGYYSLTTLDPLDDMTMWTIQEFCKTTNSYSCRVAKLLAPPPATPSSLDMASIEAGQPSIQLAVTGTPTAGSGFFDPGANLSAPALPFHHVNATITGVGTPPAVLAVTYLDPAHVGLSISTVGADPGTYSVVITNPDGQQATGNGLLTVTAVTGVTSSGGTAFRLHSIEPNPSTGRTNITFSVGRATRVQVNILDLQGREVVALADGFREPGHYTVTWDGRRGGLPAAAGVYFVRYRAAGYEDTRRMALTP